MKRLSDQTLYEIIEISVDALAEEIERACDRASATYGPGSLATYTLASPEEAALLSSRIEEARAVLLDPSARSRYDERIGVRPATPALDPEPGIRAEVLSPSRSAPSSWPPLESEPVVTDGRPVSPGLPSPPPPVERALVPVSAPQPVLPPPSGPAVGPDVLEVAPSPPPPPGPSAPVRLVAPVRAAVDDQVIQLNRPITPILLDKEVAAPAVPEGGAWSGEMLRRVRESRGLTVQELAERTRITRHHLENIEQDRFKALPAPVYLRGIIMSLARELRLDGQKVARSYLDRMGPVTAGDPRR